MGITNTYFKIDTHWILDHTIMDADVNDDALIGVGKICHTALLSDHYTGAVTLTAAASTTGVGAVAGIIAGVGHTASAGGAATLEGGAGTTTGAGGDAVINAGAGGNDAVGGMVDINGGDAGGGNRAGGAVDIDAGDGAGTAAGGEITLDSGPGANGAAAVNGGNSGDISILTAAPGNSDTGTGGAGGAINIAAHDGATTTGAGTGGAGGTVDITAGGGGTTVGGAQGGDGGTVIITGGDGGASIAGGVGGSIHLRPGDAGAGGAPAEGQVVVATAGAGHDVLIYGTAGATSLWRFDASADQLDFAHASMEMTGTLPSEGLASPYIGIGQSATPISITTFADHVLGYGAWLQLESNVANTLLGGYFKVQTDGATEVPLAQLVAVAPRVTVDMNLDSGYGVQSHMTISGTKTSSELVSVSAYVNLGAGARTADRVCALQAMFDGSGVAGTVTGAAFVAYIVNGGTVITTDSIICAHNQSAATATNMIELYNQGTCTKAFYFNDPAAGFTAAGHTHNTAHGEIEVDQNGQICYIRTWKT